MLQVAGVEINCDQGRAICKVHKRAGGRRNPPDFNPDPSPRRRRQLHGGAVDVGVRGVHERHIDLDVFPTDVGEPNGELGG